MAHVKVDRVQQTTQSTGTGVLTLDPAAIPRMFRFQDKMANGSEFWALIEHQAADEVEISYCTYNAGTITRAWVTPGSSSSTGGLVPFSGGTKTVSLIAPAGATPIVDGSGNLLVPAALIAGGTGSFVGSVVVNGAAGSVRSIDFTTAGKNRISIGIDGAESGLNAGGNLFLNVSHDDGTYLGTVLSLVRATGRIDHAYALRLFGVGTTASAANAVLDAGDGNNVLRSTSSREWKTALEPLESWRADKVIDEAELIWYRSLAPADNPEWSHYGMTAEQIAEIEPRLVQWGYRPSDYEEVPVYRTIEDAEQQVGVERRLKEGATMVPIGVAYERFTVMLIDVVRREKAKVAALQDELAALTARVDALAAAAAP